MLETQLDTIDTDTLYSIPVRTGESLLFDPNTLRIFVHRAEGKLQDAALSRSAHPTIQSRAPLDYSVRQSDRIPRPHLSRLTVHISNTCNLGCGYCYASGGDYRLGRSVMDSATAIDLLSAAFTDFDIDTLMFFGGEPSLNFDVMLDACIFVREMHRRNLITNLPSFAVISNLYNVSDMFLAACAKFGIHVTASIDGPAEIHDMNRPTRSGHGTFVDIRRNFLKAEKTGIDLSIECTYTPGHIEHGISVVDLMRFFYEEFGQRETHIVPVSDSLALTDPLIWKTIIHAFCDAVEFMVSTRGKSESLSISLGQRVLAAITEQKPIGYYCPAGNTEFALSPEGDLFPCFMLVGHKELSMGRLDGNNWLTDRGKQILESIWRNGKDEHPTCRQCWARNTCTGCIGSDYLQTGSLKTKPTCSFVKAMTAESIVRVAEASLGLPIGHYGKEHRYAFLSHAKDEVEVGSISLSNVGG